MELLVRRQKLVNQMISRREILIISISHLLQTHCMQTHLFHYTSNTSFNSSCSRHLWKEWEIKGKSNEKFERQSQNTNVWKCNPMNWSLCYFYQELQYFYGSLHPQMSCELLCTKNPGLGFISEICQRTIWQCEVRIKVWFLIYNGGSFHH